MYKKFLFATLASTLLIGCGDDAADNTDTSTDTTAVAVDTPVNNDLPDDFTLGDASYIAIGTKDIEASKAFYKKLGFQVKMEETMPYPWVYMADTSVMIGIFQDSMDYQGLAYYTNEYDAKIAGLKAAGAKFDMENEADGNRMAVYTNPEGWMPVAIIEMDPNTVPKVKGPNLLDVMKSETKTDGSTWPNNKVGVFGEYAFTTKDLAAEIAFWNKLGFDTITYTDYGDFSYAIMGDGQQIIGIHNEYQGKQFNSLTFFSVDTKKRMAQLRKEGIENVPTDDPMMGDSNFILESPEGKQVFLFNVPEESLNMDMSTLPENP